MANWNLLPKKSHREKDNLIINSLKPFKDTISKTNICFRQRHDLEPKHLKDIRAMSFQRKLFKEKDPVRVIKTQNHTTGRNSCSYVIIRELQARKHNQFSANKTSFAKDRRFRKDEYFMISNSRYLSFLETKIRFKNLNLWEQPKGHEISQKIVKKEVTGH